MAEQTPPYLPEQWPAGPAEPQVTSAVSQAPGTVNLELDVEADCPWLAGHFPGQPVLPGVVQLRWAVQLAERIWPDLRTVTGVSNLKFQNPVLPPARLRLVLQRHAQTARLDFSWYQDQERCATGRVSFE